MCSFTHEAQAPMQSAISDNIYMSNSLFYIPYAFIAPIYVDVINKTFYIHYLNNFD